MPATETEPSLKQKFGTDKHSKQTKVWHRQTFSAGRALADTKNRTRWYKWQQKQQSYLESLLHAWHSRLIDATFPLTTPNSPAAAAAAAAAEYTLCCDYLPHAKLLCFH